jgi:hypothetical protein
MYVSSLLAEAQDTFAFSLARLTLLNLRRLQLNKARW